LRAYSLDWVESQRRTGRGVRGIRGYPSIVISLAQSGKNGRKRSEERGYECSIGPRVRKKEKRVGTKKGP
jgi:hypothetical protein